MRRLLREVELRADGRATAIFALMLYSGARVSDVVSLELSDLLLGERSGQESSDSAKAESNAPCRCHCLLDVHCWRTSTPAHQCSQAMCSLVSVDH